MLLNITKQKDNLRNTIKILTKNIFKNLSVLWGKNGGADETRTRDLSRDRRTL